MTEDLDFGVVYGGLVKDTEQKLAGPRVGSANSKAGAAKRATRCRPHEGGRRVGLKLTRKERAGVHAAPARRGNRG